MVLVLGVPVGLLSLVCPMRRLVARSSVIWAKAILAMAGVRLSIHGREHVAGAEPRLYLANHQAAMDELILIVAVGGDVLFFTKDALFAFPVFGWLLRRLGHIRIERNSPRASIRNLERAFERIQRDPISVAVHPEGTRSPDGKLLPFRRGTMKICQRAGMAVTPVCIVGSGRVNPPSECVARPGPVRLTFGRTIPAVEVVNMTPDELHDRVRSAITAMLEESAPHVCSRVPTPPLRIQGETQRDQQSAAYS